MDCVVRLRGRLRDLPLLKKFNLIVYGVLLAMLIASAIGIHLVVESGNKMLYDSMHGAMTYSASILSENLQQAETMTGAILADSTVQSMLSVSANEASGDMARSNAYSTLRRIVPEYYQNYKQNGIKYVGLYTDSYVVANDYAKSAALPDDIVQALLQAAHETPGYAVWCTDYCEDYGIFISRDIRRAKSLSLDTIGTLIVNIDIDALIRETAEGLWENDAPRYVLYRDGAVIYRSSDLPFADDADLNALFQNDYGTLKADDGSYFYARGTIPDFGWQYLFLISNESVVLAQRTYVIAVAVILVVTLVLSILLSNRLFGSITQHIRCLLEKMEYFSRNNAAAMPTDYDYSLRHDEIGVLHQGFDRMAAQVQELIRKNYVNELLTKEAQLKSLENQINPHFLYNTLESINWRAKAIHADDISTMVESLGALLHTTLSKKFGESTLKSELEIVDYYMAIIKIRFDERVQYIVTVTPDLYGVPLPKLSLQPLVENAIHYALEESTDQSLIHISAIAKPDSVVIQISNSGSQFPDDLLKKLESSEITPHGFGIGLLNIHKRIRLQYGPEYGLQLRNDIINDLAVVRITLPPLGKEAARHDEAADRG